MLAPPFTRENAADNARKAVISREANRKAKLLASSPEHANNRAIKQVNKVLSWMEKERNKEEYAKLASILDRLWNMAYPKAGVMRPRSTKDHRRPTPTVSETPQEPVVISAKTQQKANDLPMGWEYD